MFVMIMLSNWKRVIVIVVSIESIVRFATFF